MSELREAAGLFKKQTNPSRTPWRSYVTYTRFHFLTHSCLLLKKEDTGLPASPLHLFLVGQLKTINIIIATADDERVAPHHRGREQLPRESGRGQHSSVTPAQDPQWAVRRGRGHHKSRPSRRGGVKAARTGVDLPGGLERPRRGAVGHVQAVQAAVVWPAQDGAPVRGDTWGGEDGSLCQELPPLQGDASQYINPPPKPKWTSC